MRSAHGLVDFIYCFQEITSYQVLLFELCSGISVHLSIKEYPRDSIIEGIHLRCKFASMSCNFPTSNVPFLYMYVKRLLLTVVIWT